MFKTDHKLWKTSIVSNTGHRLRTGVRAAFIRLRLRPRPTRLSSTANHDGLSSHPRWGRCFGSGSKKSLHGTGWCFQCREVGDYASNLAVWWRAVWSIGHRLEILAILEQRDGGGTRTTPIWELEAALKCRSCKKGAIHAARSPD
jgi:hypothetical protein